MQYNSLREPLVISEYGRNIQKLINHAKTIKDLDYKQAYVEKILDLVYQLNPQTKNTMDYKAKLWKQVFKIADYELAGVIPTHGPIPSKESEAPRPGGMSYPPNIKRFRHYGRYVQTLIEKARAVEDDEERMEFTKIIGSFMKMAYKNWNREHYVSDAVIMDDLKAMSNGELILAEDENLDGYTKAIKRHKPQNNSTNHRNNRNNNRGRNNRNRKRYKR